MPSGQGGEFTSVTLPKSLSVDDHGLAGTNPIHNKQKKKQQKDDDEEDTAFKMKQQSGE